MAFELQATEGDGERRGGRPHSTSPPSLSPSAVLSTERKIASERESAAAVPPLFISNLAVRGCVDPSRQGMIHATYTSIVVRTPGQSLSAPSASVRVTNSNSTIKGRTKRTSNDGREGENASDRSGENGKFANAWSVRRSAEKRRLSRVTEGRQRDRGRFLRCLRVQRGAKKFKHV